MLIQIKEENDILFINQMTEPCTKIIKHGLQSSFLTFSSPTWTPSRTRRGGRGSLGARATLLGRPGGPPGRFGLDPVALVGRWALV